MIPFEVFRDPASMLRRAESLRRDGLRIGVVPTMGALHDGHLSLIREARRRCDVLIVTIFVNPTQFGPGEDLDRYPKTEKTDLELAVQCGANLAFCPTPESMYPEGYQTYVEVGEISEGLCGAGRPGHFRGVATVVAKLFNATRPDVAVFGEKDYQQLAVIRQLCSDLGFGVDIVGAAIVREDDGLAMSSRNQYLDDEERRQAPVLQQALQEAGALYQAGQRSTRALTDAVRAALAKAPLARPEYVEIRDARTLSELEGQLAVSAVIAIAVRFGSTRLIDNIVLGRD